MIKSKRLLFIALAVFSNFVHIKAQTTEKQEDTIIAKILDPIFVSTYLKNAAPKFITEVVGTNIYSGKKTNQVYLDASRMNLAQNVSRTAFAQIPGLTMWDMDGAGLQINVGSRGTDSHRSIEMNMRQNGYNINSDMFGYPEDHYTPPLQAVQQVQQHYNLAASLAA